MHIHRPIHGLAGKLTTEPGLNFFPLNFIVKYWATIGNNRRCGRLEIIPNITKKELRRFKVKVFPIFSKKYRVEIDKVGNAINGNSVISLLFSKWKMRNPSPTPHYRQVIKLYTAKIICTHIPTPKGEKIKLYFILLSFAIHLSQKACKTVFSIAKGRVRRNKTSRNQRHYLAVFKSLSRLAPIVVYNDIVRASHVASRRQNYFWNVCNNHFERVFKNL